MALQEELVKEIQSKNSPNKSKIIMEFFEFLKDELGSFEYRPSKKFDSKIYNAAFDEAYKKLKEVNFRPFSLSGPIGSILLKAGHDIDMILIPKKGISSGLLLSASSVFFKSIKEKYEKKFKKRLILFTFSLHQEEIEEFSDRNEDELFIHFSRTCERFYGKNIGNKKGLKTWFPKYNLFSEDTPPSDIKDTKLDRLFFVLDDLYLFDAEYPPKILAKKVHSFKYLLKRLGVKVPEKVLNNPRETYEVTGILIDYLNGD